MTKLSPGDPLYVPFNDLAIAMSIGAAIVEGDSRLRVPKPLPDGVFIDSFIKWSTPESRLRWISEFVEQICGKSFDPFSPGSSVDIDGSGPNYIRLYVPKCEMDKARVIPGVRWSREERMYVADASASFGLIHYYLTDAMKAAWALDLNFESEIVNLTKARALIEENEIDEPKDPPENEIERDHHQEKKHNS